MQKIKQIERGKTETRRGFKAVALLVAGLALVKCGDMVRPEPHTCGQDSGVSQDAGARE